METTQQRRERRYKSLTLGSTLIADDDNDKEYKLPHIEPTTTEEFPYCRWKTLHIRLSDENSKVSTI